MGLGSLRQRPAFQVHLHWLLSPACGQEHSPRFLELAWFQYCSQLPLAAYAPGNLLWPKDQILDSDEQDLNWPQPAASRVNTTCAPFP